MEKGEAEAAWRRGVPGMMIRARTGRGIPDVLVDRPRNASTTAWGSSTAVSHRWTQLAANAQFRVYRIS